MTFGTRNRREAAEASGAFASAASAGSDGLTVSGRSTTGSRTAAGLFADASNAAAAMSYLVSLGIPASRLRTVSYGKEFPFDPGHDDAAYAKNRRAHFVITAK